jgi:murein tripeptide amidase MpaA
VAAPSRPGAPPTPATAAEASAFARTSSHAEVVAFLDTLQRSGAPMARGSIGRTGEGRDLPYVVLSRPLVRTPAEARALHRPVVYVQGNIHGGEVEGKEALLALVRDLAGSPSPGVLDSIVLVAVPIYNADGNERWGAQAAQRSAQNGPERVGQRANAQGLDLNRDYIKAEAPETRASLAAFEEWDPDVFVDLHTTNGSYHGYALTYSPSLYPGLPAALLARDSLLPELRRRMQARHDFAVFDYGNFSDDGHGAALTDSVKTGWWTYDFRPRFGSNYYALRGRVAILSEAYSHDPFARRVASTAAFVREILSLAAERRTSLERLRADTLPPSRLVLRAALPDSAPRQPGVVEVLEAAPDSADGEAGVPEGVRRTGRYITQQLPVYDRFVPTLETELPQAYLVPAADTAIVRELRQHGVQVRRLGHEWRGRVETFTIDSIVVAPREFQKHREVRLEGRWATGIVTVPAGAFVVPARQRLGSLAGVLLEPQSADGFVTWNRFDAAMKPGWAFPVFRARDAVDAALLPVP